MVKRKNAYDVDSTYEYLEDCEFCTVFTILSNEYYVQSQSLKKWRTVVWGMSEMDKVIILQV